MPGAEDYNIDDRPAWCPGCGNFAILKCVKDVLADLGMAPHEVLLVSGIGQAAKLPQYLRCNFFNGLHGRALPVATGARLVNHGLPVIVTTGDGDCYGEGGNHFLHAMRRNINLKVFVHDNQIYGLTKGQASPTSMEGMKTKVQTFGVLSEQLSPLTLAVPMDASFVARGFAGDHDFLKELMKEAINHNGFALLDILQPCVTFNKLNTFKWYRDRVYRIEPEYDPTDRVAAFKRSLEWGDKIPTGVIFKNNRSTLEERIPIIKDMPLVKQPFDPEKTLEEIKKELSP